MIEAYWDAFSVIFPPAHPCAAMVGFRRCVLAADGAGQTLDGQDVRLLLRGIPLDLLPPYDLAGGEELLQASGGVVLDAAVFTGGVFDLDQHPYLSR